MRIWNRHGTVSRANVVYIAAISVQFERTWVSGKRDDCFMSIPCIALSATCLSDVGYLDIGITSSLT